MESFINWLFINFFGVIESLTTHTVLFINDTYENNFSGDYSFEGLRFNLTLFSDTPILTTNIYDFLLIFFGVFYTVIFVVIVWKIIKKVVIKITGWNRW